MTTHATSQELPVTDWRWRWQAACVDATPELFDWRYVPRNPAELPEIDLTARLWCRGCPVREACRAEADARGYVGLWGGWWFNTHNGVWTVYDLLTGERVRDSRRRAAA